MHKYYLAVAFIILSVHMSSAQDFRAAVKGGFSLNSFSVANLTDAGTRLGVQAGLLAEIGLEDAGMPANFYLQPEINFATRGAKYNFQGIAVKERLSYFEIPVLLKYFVFDPVSIYIGPQLSLLASGKFKTDRETNDKTTNRDAFKKSDFGFAMGLNVELPKFFLDLRYTLGLRNIVGDRSIGQLAFDTEKARNRGFQLSIGYYFINR